MLWVLLSMASAFVIGAYEVARKAAVGRGPALVVLLSVTLGGLLCLSPLLVLSWAGVDLEMWGLALAPLSPTEHLLVLFKSAIVTSSWILSYIAIGHLPISVAGPLRATSPVLTVVLALLLFGEQPSTNQWAGMLVIFAGHLGFARLGRKEGIDYTKDRWIGLLALGTLLGSLSGLYDKHLLQQVKIPPTTLQIWFTVYGALLQIPGAVWALRRSAAKTASAPSELLFLPSALLAGALLVLADQLYMRAVATEGALISVVSLTRRSSVLVSFTLGGLLFRERLLRKKAWPLALILAGLACLVLRW